MSQPSTAHGTCRNCQRAVQNDRTLCKPRSGCRSETRAGTAASAPARANGATTPPAPQAPTPGQTPPQLDRGALARALARQPLADAVAAFTNDPTAWGVRGIADAAKTALTQAMAEVIERTYGREELQSFRNVGLRFYRRPEQRKWMRAAHLSFLNGYSEDQPTFWETEAEWRARRSLAPRR